MVLADTIDVRAIASADWVAILDIQRQSYPIELVESVSALYSKVEASALTCFVACYRSEVVGYLLAIPTEKGKCPTLNDANRISHSTDYYHLHDLAVSTNHRGLGVSQHLFSALQTRLVQKGCISLSLIAVEKSEAFWSKLGFVTDSSVPTAILTYGQCAVYMKKQL